jgi:hypothetical protein
MLVVRTRLVVMTERADRQAKGYTLAKEDSQNHRQNALDRYEPEAVDC